MKIKSVNLLSIIILPISIWFGITGKVDWWTIILIWLCACNITLKFKNK